MWENQKIIASFMVAWMLLVPVSLIGQTSSESKIGQHIPAVQSQIEYINSDWIVSDINITGNVTIILTGNLIVTSTGILTFYNVTLKMNCSVNGSYYINVTSGGTFYVYDVDNDNTTTEDTSIITSNYPDGSHRFLFWVRKGAYFIIKNSEIHECGYEYNAEKDHIGLFIESDYVTIDHSLISNNFYGIYLIYANITISNSTIQWNNGTGTNGVGIWPKNSSPLIIDSFIAYHPFPGLSLTFSNATIKNNVILSNGDGINTAGTSTPIIYNCQIVASAEDGIAVTAGASPTIINNYIYGGNYGIASTTDATPTIINSTIENTTLWDISAGPNCQFTVINSSFNKTKVRFSDSQANLTVQWYLNTYVNDTSNSPVPDANIDVKNVTGSSVFTGQTGTEGWRNWTVLTEYVQNDTNGDYDGEDPGEIVYHTPHNVTVAKAGYLDGYADVSMTESKYITITLGDATPPSHSNEIPSPDSYKDAPGTNVSVHVTDPSGVNGSTIQLYINGSLVPHILTPITDGYNVSYDSGGFGPGIVTCRIVADDNLSNHLDYTWNFTILATYVIPLREGWNLISVPFEQVDTSISEVLKDIAGKWDYIMAYNSTDPDHWKTNMTYRPDQLNDLKNINHKIGFWINITEPDVNLTVRGNITVYTTISLFAGWNLVGYPTQTTETVGNALWGTGADRVEVFDETDPYRLRDVGATYIMKPGEGYWVHVPADSVWVVNW